MKYGQLGRTGLQVSRIALGSMTWGEQNTQHEAFRQMDYAVDCGINFFDTAELYAIPPRAETYGATETIIGNWLKKTKRRDQLVLASKVCGPTAWCPHIRKGTAKLDAKNIIAACEGSLKRLQTDCLDLYQTHWPDRNTNYFGKLGYRHASDEQATPVEETLEALSRLIEAGKIRHAGVSNETPWGVMRHLQSAGNHSMPRIASIQNPYNLLNRTFEIGLAEIACREDVGLLAYSPLAFGVLSGKYINGKKPEGARLTLFESYTRYSGHEADQATDAYAQLAREHGLELAQMSLAFILQQPFVTSCIIGATNMQQLQQNIDSMKITLSGEVLAGIDAIHARCPNPCP